MRRYVDRQKLETFMRELGARSTTPGIVYIAGGSTALLLGIREQTVDIYVKLDPEPRGAFEAIAVLKDSLGVNVELASPDQFIPPLPGWRERSVPVMMAGKVEFRNYDLYSQVLAKIERGHELDIADALAMMHRGRLDAAELRRLADAILPEMIQYPALDPPSFSRKVGEFIQAYADHGTR